MMNKNCHNSGKLASSLKAGVTTLSNDRRAGSGMVNAFQRALFSRHRPTDLASA